MKKLLPCLLIVALIISLTLAGCTTAETGSPSTGAPDNEEITGQSGSSQHQGENGSENEEPGDDDETYEVPVTTGSIEIRVTDAPPQEDVTSIMVTISKIEIHKAVAEQEEEQEGGDDQNQEQEQEQEEQSGDGWLTLDVTGDNPFDLIELRDSGVSGLLTVEDLEVGKYTQIRLVIDEVWVTLDEQEPEEAIISSDELKLIQPFDIIEGQVTVLTVDFDAAESIHITGQGNAIVNPVVKLTVEYNPES